MHDSDENRPLHGPALPTPAEHDAMHGGRGDPNSAQGARYVMNLDRPGRLRCFPCGMPVQFDQESRTDD